MNSYEAYDILGLASEASEAEIDKAFRKKAAVLHPDVNKSDTANEDFKRINEAYQLLKHRRSAAPTQQTDFGFGFGFRGFSGPNFNVYFEDLFGRINKSGIGHQQVPSIPITINFAESISGC